MAVFVGVDGLLTAECLSVIPLLEHVEKQSLPAGVAQPLKIRPRSNTLLSQAAAKLCRKGTVGRFTLVSKELLEENGIYIFIVHDLVQPHQLYRSCRVRINQ